MNEDRRDYIKFLQEEIRERETLLDNLCRDHWLYDMQKRTLEERKVEYEYVIKHLSKRD